MKICKDGFIFKTLTREQAIELWHSEHFQLYHVDEDETGHEITEEGQLNDLLEDRATVAIEVGTPEEDDSRIILEKMTEKQPA